MAIIQQIENGKLVDSSASNTSLSTENKSDAAGGAFRQGCVFTAF